MSEGNPRFSPFYPLLGGKLLGAKFRKDRSCPVLITAEIDYIPSFFSPFLNEKDMEVGYNLFLLTVG